MGRNQVEEKKIGNQVEEEKKKMGRRQREKKRNQRQNKKNVDVFKILIESKIFLKSVPSKSDIGRCRCVCKVWRSYLSTPEFKREHLQNNQVTMDDYKLVVFDDCNKTYPYRTFSLNETLPPLLSYREYIKSGRRDAICFIASLDGLVCAVESMFGWEKLVLVNPLTGTRKTLPDCPGGFNATLDPIGFYFDPDNNDYKLLRVPMFGDEGAYVYSHRLDSWKHIEFSVSSSPSEVQCSSSATLYCQCLYFEVSRGSGTSIIRFDVKTETFKEIPVPDPTYKTDETYLPSVGFVVLKGCLHMYVSYCISEEYDGVDVWRIKDDGEWEWVNAYKVVPAKNHELKLLEVIETTTDNWLVVWDFDDNSFKETSTEEFTTYNPGFHSIGGWQDRLIYVQTLVDP